MATQGADLAADDRVAVLQETPKAYVHVQAVQSRVAVREQSLLHRDSLHPGEIHGERVHVRVLLDRVDARQSVRPEGTQLRYDGSVRRVAEAGAAKRFEDQLPVYPELRVLLMLVLCVRLALGNPVALLDAHLRARVDSYPVHCLFLQGTEAEVVDDGRELPENVVNVVVEAKDVAQHLLLDRH